MPNLVKKNVYAEKLTSRPYKIKQKNLSPNQSRKILDPVNQRVDGLLDSGLDLMPMSSRMTNQTVDEHTPNPSSTS